MTAPVVNLPEGATSEIEWVIPDQALEWLENTNTHNRTISQVEVNKLAEAIIRGEWRLNGDAIRFDVNGVLLDGQHRLWACVQSETPIQTCVVRGLEPEAQRTIDVGRRRTLNDTLSIDGRNGSKQLPAAVGIIWRIALGVPMSNKTPTITQGIEVLDANPGLVRASVRGESWRKQVPIPGSVLAACYHLAQDIDADGAPSFFEGLASGVELVSDDPRFVLRRWAIRQQGSRARSPQWMYVAMVTKAWNAWRQGRKVQNLSFRPGGTSPEDFPVMA